LGLLLPLEELRRLVKAEVVERYEEGFDVDVNACLKRADKTRNAEELMKLYEELCEASLRKDYPYVEPNDSDGILRERPESFRILESPENLEDKLLGEWLGRACGCMLGKPIEGWARGKIRERLEKAGGGTR